MEETIMMIDRRIKILEESLTKLEPGSDEYDLVQKSLTELIKLRASVSTNEIDVREKKKDRWIRVGIAGAEITVPLVVYSILWKQGLRFERDGYVSSNSVKSLFQKFKFF